jgi:hypothetical protein
MYISCGRFLILMERRRAASVTLCEMLERFFMKTLLPIEWSRSDGTIRNWAALAVGISCFPVERSIRFRSLANANANRCHRKHKTEVEVRSCYQAAGQTPFLPRSFVDPHGSHQTESGSIRRKPKERRQTKEVHPKGCLAGPTLDLATTRYAQTLLFVCAHC